MQENQKIENKILFPYLKSKILEKIVSDELLIAEQDKKDYKKVQEESNECEVKIEETLSEAEFSELKDNIEKDLEQQHVKNYIKGNREIIIKKQEKDPYGGADLGLVIQNLDSELIIERAFMLTLIKFEHQFEHLKLSFLEKIIKNYKITDKDILNIYKDLRAKAGLPDKTKDGLSDKTKDGLSDSYLRQYIKVLLENKIYL